MFTGIVQGVGRVRSVEPRGGDVAMWIETGDVSLAGVETGGSIAVNGCCLTAIEFDGNAFKADLSRETLALTTAGAWAPGTRVNLERALTAGQALGGHYVTGHVDGVGRVARFEPSGESWLLEVDAPAALGKFFAYKGSIVVNGVSLTVNRVEDLPGHCRVSINLIPHTLQHTNLHRLHQGSEVNLEIDLIARYCERMLSYQNTV